MVHMVHTWFVVWACLCRLGVRVDVFDVARSWETLYDLFVIYFYGSIPLPFNASFPITSGFSSFSELPALRRDAQSCWFIRPPGLISTVPGLITAKGSYCVLPLGRTTFSLPNGTIPVLVPLTK